jgi:hypothetical protein
MKYKSLVYCALATSPLIAMEENQSNFNPHIILAHTLPSYNQLLDPLQTHIHEYDENGNLIKKHLAPRIKLCNSNGTPLKTCTDSNKFTIELRNLPTAPRIVYLHINNEKIRYGDRICLIKDPTQKNHLEIKNYSNEKMPSLLQLPLAGTSLTIGKKKHCDVTENKNITILNKNIECVTITNSAYRQPIKYTETVNNPNKTTTIKLSKLICAKTTTLLKKEQSSITTASSAKYKSIVDVILTFSIYGALQKLKIHSSALKSGDILTIQKPENLNEIEITNQNNEVIAALFTKDSYIDLS